MAEIGGVWYEGAYDKGESQSGAGSRSDLAGIGPSGACRVRRTIESRHRSDYDPTPEELQAIDDADRSGVAPEEDVEAVFRTFRAA